MVKPPPLPRPSTPAQPLRRTSEVRTKSESETYDVYIEDFWSDRDEEPTATRSQRVILYQRLAQILDQLSEGQATELIELGEMFTDLGPDDRRTLLHFGEYLLKQVPPGEK